VRLFCIDHHVVILHSSSIYSALLFTWLICIPLHAVILNWSSRGYWALPYTWLFCIFLHGVILYWSWCVYSALIFLQLFFVDLYVVILHCSSFMTGNPCRRRDMQPSLSRQHYFNSILSLQLTRRRCVEDLDVDGRAILKWT